MFRKNATLESPRTLALRQALHVPDIEARRKVLGELIAARDPADVGAIPLLLGALAARKRPEPMLIEALRAMPLRAVATLTAHHLERLHEIARAGHPPGREAQAEFPALD